MNIAPNKIEIPALAANHAYPWTPDGGDGTYRNPVLYADYSDPDVVRHGDDFYLVASSFNCTPGLPVLHSRDLVNWTILAHAIKNLPHPRYCRVQPGCGVWAPAIRFHAGKFWIFFPMPDEGIYVTTALNPAGPWSEPHLVQAGKGLIDPCPLWDDDGQAYLVHAYAYSRSGIKHKLRVCPMAPDGSQLLGEGQIVFHDPARHHTIEGPKFLKRDGWYYILAPAGSVASGWQTVLRSRNIFGPYEDKIVLEQGRTAINGPHQGALVDTAAGDWWFVHFQDAGVYGRVVHLQPVTWRDGWPLMGRDLDGNGIGEPVLHFEKPDFGQTSSVRIPQTSDEFDSSQLSPQWQWPANHEAGWHSLAARRGWLRLFARPLVSGDLAQTPNVLLQKFPAREFAIEAQLELPSQSAGIEAGVVVMGNAHAAVGLRPAGTGCEIVFRSDGGEKICGRLAGRSARLRVEVREGGRCAFSLIDDDGTVLVIPELFQAREGKWIGAKIGLYCVHRDHASGVGYADFDFFRFSANASSR